MIMNNRIPTINNTQIKCVQWNARGLNKAKLEEFRSFVSSVKPEIVLLSETHWNSAFNVEFSTYYILKKYRTSSRGGGVAIFVHKSLIFSHMHLNSTDTLEVIGVTIKCKNNENLSFISAYAPHGKCETAEVEEIINFQNAFVTGGDFNGHHNT